MKNPFALLSVVLLLAACQPEAELMPKDPVHEYFKEITLGAEFSAGDRYIRKWKNDLYVFVSGTPQPELESELERILTELNGLLETIQVQRTDDSLAANYFIFFGSAKNYVHRFNPEAKHFVSDNLGLFSVRWNERCEIYQGSMYVDTERCRDSHAQKHLLREELTQSLGFFNDSFLYPSSIFQEQWTKTTFYSHIDRQLIGLLYLETIQPCMEERALDSLLKGFSGK